jgi:hypothetical protein
MRLAIAQRTRILSGHASVGGTGCWMRWSASRTGSSLAGLEG